MPSPLPANATLHDMRSAPRDVERFARSVLGVMKAFQETHGEIVIRVGVTGTGIEPNYRIESVASGPICAIDGANHRPWPNGVRFDSAANWSSVTMTYQNVQDVIAAATGGRSPPR